MGYQLKSLPECQIKNKSLKYWEQRWLIINMGTQRKNNKLIDTSEKYMWLIGININQRYNKTQ